MSSVPGTMRAVRIERFGGPEVMQVTTVETPRPAPDEVLVRVMAASLNPVDWKIRRGKYPAVGEDMLPYVLGRDFCGEVVARGDAVAEFAERDAVHGLLDIARGSFAEFAVARAGEVAPRPRGLDATTAAAVPLAALTAWQGLFRHGGLQAGQRVLIHGASGGVGHFAVQFARARGAHVIATAGTDHVEFVRGLGAGQVVDYQRQRFEQFAHDVDLVYDLIGGETQERSWPVLRSGGTLVTTLAEPSQDKANVFGVHALRYTAQASAADLREIDALIEAGQVKPHVSRTWPLRDARAALQALEEGHTQGKTVLVI